MKYLFALMFVLMPYGASAANSAEADADNLAKARAVDEDLAAFGDSSLCLETVMVDHGAQLSAIRKLIRTPNTLVSGALTGSTLYTTYCVILKKKNP